MTIHEWFGIPQKAHESDDYVDFDGVCVHIESISDDIARGTYKTEEGEIPYFIAKEGSVWVGGRTERAARLALKQKMILSKSEDERIADFVSLYPTDAKHTTDEWIEAHHRLTGSCEMGARRFIRSKGIQRYDRYTTLEFLDIVDGAYGGELIAKVKQQYQKKQ